MCGIAGILQWQPDAPFPASILTRMCDLMQHRGPDDSGISMSPDRQVRVGFRRLVIVDLIRRRPTTQMWYLYNFVLWWRRCIRNQHGPAS